MRITESGRQLRADLLLFLGVNGAFYMVSALLLWPLNKAPLSGQLAKGFCVFLIILLFAITLGVLLQKLFRIEDDPPSDAFVIMNILISGVVQLGWAAFAALAAREHAAGAWWVAGSLVYLVGLIASWLAQMLTGAFFQGSIYKTITGLVALIGYLLFAFLPGAARALFGWFFA